LITFSFTNILASRALHLLANIPAGTLLQWKLETLPRKTRLLESEDSLSATDSAQGSLR